MSEIKENTIGKDFTLAQLGKFVAGPVLSQLLVSVLQTLDDSIFLSRYCGENALAAFSMAMPFFMVVDAFGMLFAAVGNLCSIKMGEKKQEQAKSDFTTMCIVVVCIGLCFTLLLCFFLNPVLKILGITDTLMPYATTFMKVSRFNIPFIQLSYVTSRFYFIAGKPKYSVFSTALNTCSNLFFDYIFIAKLGWGIKGAAVTNLISAILVFLFSMTFFFNKNHEMHFVRPASNPIKLSKEVFRLGKASFITSLSISLNSYISNSVQLSVGGEVLIAAFSIVNGVQFMFMNVFFSLIGTTMPMVGYAYGEKNAKKLSKILKQILTLVTITIVCIISIFLFGRTTIEKLYLTESSSDELRSLVDYGLRVVPFAFLFFGYNVLVQEVANSVNNSKLSTILSIIENVIFSNLFMLILPRVFGVKLTWHIFTIAELSTFIFSLIAVYNNKDVYGYGKDQIATFTNEH